MKRDNGQGMFTMDFINEVAREVDINAAKCTCYERIEASTANPDNKHKAKVAVNKATNLRSLLLTLSNFSLSHQGLAVR